ncbi:MAG: NAD(P)-dependent oxidoreductase [Actinobacteria bacterium]|nr:NAD(P)-dependent oxidoreductase [Actinomycetota bacterium]
MRLAVIGTGMMGGRMARRLLDAGHELSVYNRTAARTESLAAAGAAVAATPREAAAGAAAVLTVLADPAAVRAVAYGDDGLLAGTEAGALWLDHSTVAPEDSREFAAAAREDRVRMVDAPMSGSLAAAEKGMLVFLVGGPAEDVAEARPILDALGRASVHLGSHGAGTAGKLAVNAFLLTAMAAAVEAVRLGRVGGVEPGTLLAGLGPTEVVPQWALGKLRKLEASDARPAFTLALAAKDLGLMERTAAGAELELPLLDAARELYAAALDAGRGDLDFSAVEGAGPQAGV